MFLIHCFAPIEDTWMFLFLADGYFFKDDDIYKLKNKNIIQKKYKFIFYKYARFFYVYNNFFFVS